MDLANFRSVFKINCVIQWNYEIFQRLQSVNHRRTSEIEASRFNELVDGPQRYRSGRVANFSRILRSPKILSVLIVHGPLWLRLSRRNPNEKCEKLEEKQEIRQTVIYVT